MLCEPPEQDSLLAIDFSCMDFWQIYAGPSAEKARVPAKLASETLQMEKSESNGGKNTPKLFRRTHVGVGFDFAPLPFHNATQLALHGFECVMDHFFQQFVSAVIHLSFIGHKLVPPCHRHVDPAPVWISFIVGVIGLLDGDIAAVDVITKSLESC